MEGFFYKYVITFCSFFALINFTQSNSKLPYVKGTVCNFEAYYNNRVKTINMFFCVPSSLCKAGFHRYPLMPYDGCDRAMTSPSVERLVCCHQDEVLEDWKQYSTNYNYLPGVRSYMMCKEHSQAICGREGPYCDLDATDAKTFLGLPTVINKYPHTALVGYFDFNTKDWFWVCQGSIISRKYVLTLWSCASENGKKSATNVKIGESRICHYSHCPDSEGELNLRIIATHKQNSNMGSLGLYEVSNIQFNENVRPACLYYEINTIQTQGWFARYGKPETLILTTPGKRPGFLIPKDEHTFAFKIKTAEEARLFFSKSGLPYKKELYYEVVLGTAKNKESMITNSHTPDHSRPSTPVNMTDDILSADHFRGFWVHIQPHNITVGKEDSVEPFLTYNDETTDFSYSVVGLSTPNSIGEWIITDYKTLSSLHDFEMENTFNDECKRAVMGLGDVTKEEDEAIRDTDVFCAQNAKKKFGPCTHDWGGTIQVMEEEFFCMWQIFGVFLQNSPTDCSVVLGPSLFKLLNTPTVLTWIEGIAFLNFTIASIKLEQPVCTNPDPSIEGRCLKPYFPH